MGVRWPGPYADCLTDAARSLAVHTEGDDPPTLHPRAAYIIALAEASSHPAWPIADMPCDDWHDVLLWRRAIAEAQQERIAADAARSRNLETARRAALGG